MTAIATGINAADATAAGPDTLIDTPPRPTAATVRAARTAVSLVAEHPALLPAEAVEYVTGMLRRYTDAADVYADLTDGVTEIVVVDVRSPETFAREHIPGAINIPHRTMGPATRDILPLGQLVVLYCDGIGCNGSTKGAANLAALGYRVKELIGGIAFWKYEGFPVASDVNDIDRATSRATAAEATSTTNAATTTSAARQSDAPACDC